MIRERIFTVSCGKDNPRHYFVKAVDAGAISGLAVQLGLGKVKVETTDQSNGKFAFSIFDVQRFEKNYKNRAKAKPEVVVSIEPYFGFVAKVKGTGHCGTGSSLNEALGNLVRYNDVLRLNFQTGTP